MTVLDVKVASNAHHGVLVKRAIGADDNIDDLCVNINSFHKRIQNVN
jgi:hypothetical protein